MEDEVEVTRTPSVVAEAMSRPLPDSRATSTASPGDQVVVDVDTDTDQQVPVVDEQSRDDVPDANDQETGHDDVEQQEQEQELPTNDENDTAELVLEPDRPSVSVVALNVRNENKIR